MKKSIRDYFELTGPYHALCREERNLCALLHHLLLSNSDNLPQFLKAIGHESEKKIENPEIYLEYAHLRDIWREFGEGTQCSRQRNRVRREFILDALDLHSREGLRNADIQAFNKFFVARKSPSSREIESPSNWSIKQLDKSFPDGNREGDTFIQAVRFKWCFNVKPDIVIFLSPNQVISIEAKLYSAESKYPSGEEESTIFNRRKLPKVAQTSIQKQVFKLLGINAHHVILAKNPRAEEQFAWKDVLSTLDVSQESRFVKHQIASFMARC